MSPKPTKRAIKQKSAKNPEEMKLRALADSVGDFIRYWGFRRIHGRIWTEIYLSKQPLSAVELTKLLGISKALASLALNELLEYKLIFCKNPDEKTKRYIANENVYGVIKKILIGREKVLIKKSQDTFEALEESLKKIKPEDMTINIDRLKNLGTMISSAVLAIDFIVETSSEEAVSNWLDVAKT